MFNLTSLLGMLGKDPMAAIKAQAAKVGIAPAMLDEILNDMKKVMADGKLSKDEMVGALRGILSKRGVPAQAIETALAMARKKLGV